MTGPEDLIAEHDTCSVVSTDIFEAFFPMVYTWVTFHFTKVYLDELREEHVAGNDRDNDRSLPFPPSLLLRSISKSAARGGRGREEGKESRASLNTPLTGVVLALSFFSDGDGGTCVTTTWTTNNLQSCLLLALPPRRFSRVRTFKGSRDTCCSNLLSRLLRKKKSRSRSSVSLAFASRCDR